MATCFWTDFNGCAEVCPEPVYVQGSLGIYTRASDWAIFLGVPSSVFGGSGFVIEHARVYKYEWNGCDYAKSAPIPAWVSPDFLAKYPAAIHGFGTTTYLDKGSLALGASPSTMTMAECHGNADETQFFFPLDSLLAAIGDDGSQYSAFFNGYNGNPCSQSVLIYLHLVASNGEESYVELQQNTCY